ncbi:MAG: barstar family protein [Lachnospiraceae bacterium]
MKRIVLDGNILADGFAAQNYLKEKLDFPEYYGGNLDALHDCLAEMKDVEIVITPCEVQTRYFQILMRVFHDSAEENAELRILRRE